MTNEVIIQLGLGFIGFVLIAGSLWVGKDRYGNERLALRASLLVAAAIILLLVAGIQPPEALPE